MLGLPRGRRRDEPHGIISMSDNPSICGHCGPDRTTPEPFAGLKPDRLRHLPQLDGLRAVAVLLVLWVHFPYVAQSNASKAFWMVGQATRAGYLGVDLFFVLSGFL